MRQTPPLLLMSRFTGTICLVQLMMFRRNFLARCQVRILRRPAHLLSMSRSTEKICLA